MRIHAGPGVPEWAIAVTRPDDVLVFRLDRIDTQPAHRLDLVLRHEVVHLVLNHLPHGRTLPRWFEEGLCVHWAGVPYLEADTTLERIAAAGTLPRFDGIDEYFRGDGRRAAIGYRYGHAVVAYFVERFGDDLLRLLLRRIAAGDDFEAAFREATGRDLASFEEAWRAEVTPRVPFVLFVLLENLELTLLCLGALLVVGGWVRWRLRRERALQRLEDEPA